MSTDPLEEKTYEACYTRVLGEPDQEGLQLAYHCPFPACDGHWKKTFGVDPALGGWCCRRCHYAPPGKVYRKTAKQHHGGTWQEFVHLMDDNPDFWPSGPVKTQRRSNPLKPEEVVPIWTELIQRSQLFDCDRKIVEARGIDPDFVGCVSIDRTFWHEYCREIGEELAIRAGLAYRSDGPEGDGRIHPTRMVQAGRILLPYWSDETVRNEVHYLVGYRQCPAQRATDSDDWYCTFKKRWAKLVGPMGYSPPFYGTVPLGSPYAIITEGQWKRAAAAQYGFPTLGKSGIGRSDKEIATYLRKQKVERALIVYDIQLDSRTRQVKRFLPEVESQATTLLLRGITVWRVDLPLAPGCEKVDLDSYLLEHGPESLYGVLAEAARNPYRLNLTALPSPVPESLEEVCE